MNQGIKLLKSLLFIFCSMAMLPSSGAQIMINEYSASNLNGFLDSFGRTEDWIEIYNAGSSTVNIGGYHLSDKESKPMKWAIPQGTSIQAGGHRLFYCSGRDGNFNGEYHTNFKLAQTSGKDIILLADPSGNILEQYDMQLTLVEHARGRESDGSPNWKVKTFPTPGSDNGSFGQYDGYTTAPSMDLEAGYYEENQVVTVTNNEPNSVIRYTLDGTNPTASSPMYNGPITVTETTVVKAQAYSNNPAILPGKMDFNTYFINEDYSLAVFSVAADDVIELANGDGELIPIGSIEYFNTNKEREATSFGSLNRHGQDSWVLTHRSLDWVSRDEMGYSKAVNAPLFSYSDRDEYQKFMFRNSGDDNYPAIGGFANQGSTHVRDEYVQTLAQNGDLNLDVRGVERVIVFLNGRYWGVYGMRDRPVDHDYTDYYYDQGKYDVQYLTTWGNTEIPYGGEEAFEQWENLRDFIFDNDMSIPENYKIAEDSINMTSMIDYMLVNLNVVASDWLNYNTGWWRGLNPDGDHKKWGFILWDLDATFDFYINYSGVPNTDPDADPCDLEVIAGFTDGWGVGYHGGLFLKLLEESPEFQQLYYGRYADLMNTVFNCENMNTVLDSMVATIRPEMPKQIERWGGTMNEWESNITRLKDFVNERCHMFDDGARECYSELSGPYEITLMVEPNIGIGEIDISTLDIETFPWTGSYFGGVATKIKAKVFDEYDEFFEFSHWETSTGESIAPNELERRAEIFITQPGTLTAVFVPLGDDLDQDGYLAGEDCNDLDATINPAALEVCDGIDNNCDGQIDEGIMQFTFYADADGDGFGDPNVFVQDCASQVGFTLNNTDCDDTNPNINETALEIPNNEIDENCDGIIEETDLDNDGYNGAEDCDDNNPNINPGVAEICDGIDNNCDGQIDEGVMFTFYLDADNDGYGDSQNSIESCSAVAGYTLDDSDCDDTNPDISPGATEICDDIDNNCDGQVDEGLSTTYYADSDGDGFGDLTSSIQSCGPVAGYVLDNSDCDDSDDDIHPNADEICDDLDNNCNGEEDEGFVVETYYLDSDLDGYGTGAGFQDCNQPFDAATQGGDCDDSDPSINPDALEIPNNDIDENCDGIIAVIDEDGDGWNSDEDCDDGNAEINPDATEINANGVDEDCDGLDGPSANENILDAQIFVFPNPVSEILFIDTQLKNLQLDLLNVEGIKVLEATGQNALDLTQLPDGIYLLYIKTTDGDELVKPIIKIQ